MASVTRGRAGFGRIFQRKRRPDPSELEHGELKRTLGAATPRPPGHRLHYRHRYIRAHRSGGRAVGGPGNHDLVRHHRRRALRPGGPVLRRTGFGPAGFGSAYSCTYASMGEVVAWVMGVLLLLEYGLAASVVAVGLVGLFCQPAARSAYRHPAGADCGSGSGGGRGERGDAGWCRNRQPAGDLRHRGSHHPFGDRSLGIGDGQ